MFCSGYTDMDELQPEGLQGPPYRVFSHWKFGLASLPEADGSMVRINGLFHLQDKRRVVVGVITH